MEIDGGRDRRYAAERIHVGPIIRGVFSISHFFSSAACALSLAPRREIAAIHVDSLFPPSALSSAPRPRKFVARLIPLSCKFSFPSFHRVRPVCLVHCSPYPQRYLRRDSFRFRSRRFNIPRLDREKSRISNRSANPAASEFSTSEMRKWGRFRLGEKDARRSRSRPLCDKAHCCVGFREPHWFSENSNGPRLDFQHERGNGSPTSANGSSVKRMT